MIVLFGYIDKNVFTSLISVKNVRNP